MQFQVQSVDPYVRPVALDKPVEKCRPAGVNHLAKSAYLNFRDAARPQLGMRSSTVPGPVFAVALAVVVTLTRRIHVEEAGG